MNVQVTLKQIFQSPGIVYIITLLNLRTELLSIYPFVCKQLVVHNNDLLTAQFVFFWLSHQIYSDCPFFLSVLCKKRLSTE